MWNTLNVVSTPNPDGTQAARWHFELRGDINDDPIEGLEILKNASQTIALYRQMKH